jgi:hypothetical protein
MNGQKASRTIDRERRLGVQEILRNTAPKLQVRAEGLRFDRLIESVCRVGAPTVVPGTCQPHAGYPRSGGGYNSRLMLALLTVRDDHYLEAPEATTRERRFTIARWVALGIWASVLVYRSCTAGLAFNRELLLVYICTGLIAASIGRRRLLLVLRDWLPFAGILFVYDLSRGAATLLGAPTLWEIQPRLDRWLFFGAEPTVWLQEHIKRAHPPWWEVLTSIVYMSLFVVPYAVGGIAWLQGRPAWQRSSAASCPPG